MSTSSKSYPDDALVALGPGAQIIGVSRTTLRKYADDGLLPVFRTPTGQRRFLVADLRALITVEPTSDKAAS
jgi:DNA-binding transcriptional MerR regulator